MKLELKRKSDEAHDHFVPLSKRAIEAITVLRTITGDGPLVFPSDRSSNKPPPSIPTNSATAPRKELAQIWANLILKKAKPAASLLDGPRR